MSVPSQGRGSPQKQGKEKEATNEILVLFFFFVVADIWHDIVGAGLATF